MRKFRLAAGSAVLLVLFLLGFANSAMAQCVPLPGEQCVPTVPPTPSTTPTPTPTATPAPPLVPTVKPTPSTSSSAPSASAPLVPAASPDSPPVAHATYAVPNDIAYGAGSMLVNNSFPHFDMLVEVYRRDPRFARGRWKWVSQVRSGCEGHNDPYMKARWTFTTKLMTTYVCGDAAYVQPTPQTGDPRYLFRPVDHDSLKGLRGTYRSLRSQVINYGCARTKSNAIWGLKHRQYRGRRARAKKRLAIRLTRRFRCHRVESAVFSSGRNILRQSRCPRRLQAYRKRQMVLGNDGLYRLRRCGKPSVVLRVPLRR